MLCVNWVQDSCFLNISQELRKKKLLCVQQPVIHPGWLLYHVGIFLQIEESVYLSKYTGNGLLIRSADCKPHNVPFFRLNLS